MDGVDRRLFFETMVSRIVGTDENHDNFRLVAVKLAALGYAP